MYLYSGVLSGNVGISIKKENVLTGLRLLTRTVTSIFHSLVVPLFLLLCFLATLFFARFVLIPKCTFVSNVVH